MGRGRFAHAGTRTPIAPSLCGCGLEAARGEASRGGRGGRREAEAIASRGSRRLDVVRGRRGGADRFRSPLRSLFHTQLFPPTAAAPHEGSWDEPTAIETAVPAPPVVPRGHLGVPGFRAPRRL